ncbi:aminotransferase class III-fold pyridoxal phosphate-dependent enzyme [Nocardioides convexus]|uniref:aminotransferase class III-fold pyridoxal phosphate-dependent enzyme n=1 Tax=Nocardioides convexus TaxID=2712224 RepID=UPI002418AEBF|nr:aminotransferase class III-fold pyridoxal phosphate-dependent enzyme [Nocardioides convexus]
MGTCTTRTRTPRSSSPPATTCGCTSPGCRPTTPPTSPSSSAVRAPTSGTRRAASTSTPSAGSSSASLGHGRTDLAEAAAKQAAESRLLPAVVLRAPDRDRDSPRRSRATRPATSTGSSSPRAAARPSSRRGSLAKNYFKITGKPMKHKVISRAIAYHGTTHGALSITGLPGLKQQFEPLVPSTFRVPNTNIYRAPIHGEDPEAFGRWAADQIAVAIENEGPDTVAAVFLEPVQNAGGCFPPPPGYFQRVREICDEYDVLLVSDEVICAYGRLGHMFGAERYGYQPDIITSAKGITSGYAPLGAMIASDRLYEPFAHGTETFLHGYTFGGHPVSTAVALKNFEIFENEKINEGVLEREGAFRGTLEKAPRPAHRRRRPRRRLLLRHREPSRTRRPRRPSTRPSPSACCAASSPRRSTTPGSTAAPTTAATRSSRLSPPLICDQSHFDEIEQKAACGAHRGRRPPLDGEHGESRPGPGGPGRLSSYAGWGISCGVTQRSWAPAAPPGPRSRTVRRLASLLLGPLQGE